MVKINKCQTSLKNTIHSLFSAVFFHREFWTSSIMLRTNEVSFWTNIQTQGHKSGRVRKVIPCGKSLWLRAPCSGSTTARFHRQGSAAAAWKKRGKTSALCYQINNLNSSQTYNDRCSTDCQGPWHVLVSHLKVNSSAWLSDFRRGIRLAPLLLPRWFSGGNWRQQTCYQDYIPFVKGFNLVFKYLKWKH